MFGAKTKREIQASGMSSSTSTMSAVNQKMDDLQSTLDQEQAAISNESSAAPYDARQNVIGKGTVIEGNVQAEGDLVVEGIVKGDVTTKTKLVVGTLAIIEGNIVAQHAEIAGRVQGTVKALGLLVINSSGTILGDVITKDLNVESGSSFLGRLQVGGNISSTPIEIAKVAVAPVVVAPVAVAKVTAAPVTASAVFADPVECGSVFDSPSPKSSSFVKSDKTDDFSKAAEQLAANLAKSSLLR